MAASKHADEVKKWKFNRQRESDTDKLRNNCTAGYIFNNSGTYAATGKAFLNAAGNAEYHHVLPCEVLQDKSIRPQKSLEFFHDCMAITEWDINANANLISLPTMYPFRDDDKRISSTFSALTQMAGGMGITDGAAGNFGGPPDLPCHWREHNPDYNRAVNDWLVSNLWKPLAKEKKACNISAQDIAGQLDSASARWRLWLKSRGESFGGAATCWRQRHETKYAAIWFIPLSMSPTPQPVKPPPNIGKMSSTRKELLDKIFQAIK